MSSKVDNDNADNGDAIVETKKEDVLKSKDSYQPQGNMSALVMYTLLIGFGNLQAGFAIAGNN
jgi:hypothetical protein